MHLSARIAQNCTPVMNNKLDLLQLNVGKQIMVQQSLLNDSNLKEYAALVVLEPHVWRTEGELRIVPLHHRNWTKVIPTTQSEERWAIRSMLWVRSDLTAVQIPIPSSDLVGVILHVGEKRILLVAVYVPCQNAQALQGTVRLIERIIVEAQRQSAGAPLDVLIVGDFNRHDHLWGEDNVSEVRQGEAEPIVDMMARFRLQSMLPRGTPTWQRGSQQSTIDLVLAGGELPNLLRKCDIYEIEHGSEHRAISSQFETIVPKQKHPTRYLWQNAPWGKIRGYKQAKGSPAWIYRGCPKPNRSTDGDSE